MTADPRRWIAEIPEPARHRPDERWLVIESSPDTGGWFLFTCTTPTDVKWDSWYATREEAFGAASLMGVTDADWRMAEQASRRER